MGSSSCISGYSDCAVVRNAWNFSACSLMESALKVAATLPLRERNLPSKSAASEPLANVSIETTAKRPESGASVETQTTGVLDLAARFIHERKFLGRLGNATIPLASAFIA